MKEITVEYKVLEHNKKRWVTGMTWYDNHITAKKFHDLIMTELFYWAGKGIQYNNAYAEVSIDNVRVFDVYARTYSDGAEINTEIYISKDFRPSNWKLIKTMNVAK